MRFCINNNFKENQKFMHGSCALKGAMSWPAHVYDSCLLCWFSQLSAILDLGNPADFSQQMSVYSTGFSEFLLIHLSIFFVQFHCRYRHKIMISDEAMESVVVSFIQWCWYLRFLLWIRAFHPHTVYFVDDTSHYCVTWKFNLLRPNIHIHFLTDLVERIW